MNKTALVIGATGLVGKQLIRLLIENDSFSEIRVFARRSIGLTHSKLQEHIIDFEKPEEWESQLTGDVLFSTLGTTLKVAGSKENQYKVDYSYQYSFARIAAANKVPCYVLVSSAGANSKSSIFYSKMKGELDEAVSKLSFESITILRPSILDGNREEKRLAEKISLIISRILLKVIFRKYRPIKDKIVAQAMINAAVNRTEGFRIVEAGKVFELAGR